MSVSSSPRAEPPFVQLLMDTERSYAAAAASVFVSIRDELGLQAGGAEHFDSGVATKNARFDFELAGQVIKSEQDLTARWKLQNAYVGLVFSQAKFDILCGQPEIAIGEGKAALAAILGVDDVEFEWPKIHAALDFGLYNQAALQTKTGLHDEATNTLSFASKVDVKELMTQSLRDGNFEHTLASLRAAEVRHLTNTYRLVNVRQRLNLDALTTADVLNLVLAVEAANTRSHAMVKGLDSVAAEAPIGAATDVIGALSDYYLGPVEINASVGAVEPELVALQQMRVAHEQLWTRLRSTFSSVRDGLAEGLEDMQSFDIGARFDKRFSVTSAVKAVEGSPLANQMRVGYLALVFLQLEADISEPKRDLRALEIFFERGLMQQLYALVSLDPNPQSTTVERAARDLIPKDDFDFRDYLGVATGINAAISEDLAAITTNTAPADLYLMMREALNFSLYRQALRVKTTDPARAQALIRLASAQDVRESLTTCLARALLFDEIAGPEPEGWEKLTQLATEGRHKVFLTGVDHKDGAAAYAVLRTLGASGLSTIMASGINMHDSMILCELVVTPPTTPEITR